MIAKLSDDELAAIIEASRAEHAARLAAEIVATRLDIAASHARWQQAEDERWAQARRARGIRQRGDTTCQTRRAS
ncbi:MAG: hypothetical protein M1522_02310 [Actinobacteria bacterium]|nr:hypothetical protein [Actinomycetota bacterium]